MKRPVEISGPQALRLRDALVALYRGPADFTELLLEVDKDYEQMAAYGFNYSQNVLVIVKTGAAGGWLLDLIAVTLQTVADPALEALQKELTPLTASIPSPAGPAPGPAGPTPKSPSQYEVCCLTGSHVMVDRKDLRAGLEMLGKNEKRILAVKGSRKSGKSHSVQLISHLEQRVGGFSMVHIDLEALALANAVRISQATNTAPIEITTNGEHGFSARATIQIQSVEGNTAANGLWNITVTSPSKFALMGSAGNGAYTSGGLASPAEPVEPWDLARALVLQLVYSPAVLPERPKDAQWARWVVDFCNAFVGHAKKDPETRWIVIDAFSTVMLSQATIDLIKQLALLINVSLPRFRMVLLGYSDTFPGPALPIVIEENIKPIDLADIIKFFGSAFQEKSVPFDVDKVAEAVGRLLNKVNLTEAGWLSKFGPAALEELQRETSPGGD